VIIPEKTPKNNMAETNLNSIDSGTGSVFLANNMIRINKDEKTRFTIPNPYWLITRRKKTKGLRLNFPMNYSIKKSHPVSIKKYKVL
jgi:hypothetical protein